MGYAYDGPMFGNRFKHDLAIADSCEGSYSMLGSSYIGKNACDITLFGEKFFIVQEYEVFGIEFY